MNIKIKLHIKKQQQKKAYLENPWNLISLSSVHISLRDWPHMKQFATQEGKKTRRNPLTFVTCFLLYIFQEDRASKEKTPQRKTLTRYPVPSRGWTAPYPARHCRTESSYYSPPHTANVAETNERVGETSFCITKNVSEQRNRATHTCFFHPYLLMLARLGIDSQPSNLDSEKQQRRKT